MLPLRYSRYWLAAGFVFLALGLVSALSPISSRIPVTLNDKLLHTGGFLFFMLWFGGIFRSGRLPYVVVALSAYGLLVEVLQSFTPTRQAEFLDLIADVVGVLVGWAVTAAGTSLWCAKLESWFVRPGR
jgi:VanZ family protein